MNPDTPQTPREELEVRLTALLMGELSPEEAVALQAQIAADPELATLHGKLRKTVELLRQATAVAADEPAPAKLSDERRTRLLAHFKTAPASPEPAPIVRIPRRDWSWVAPMGIAAAVVALLGGGLLLPGYISRERARYRQQILATGIPPLDPDRGWQSQPGMLNTFGGGTSASSSGRAYSYTDLNAPGFGTNGKLPAGTPAPSSNNSLAYNYYRDNSVTVGGDLQASGALTKTGAGTLILQPAPAAPAVSISPVITADASPERKLAVTGGTLDINGSNGIAGGFAVVPSGNVRIDYGIPNTEDTFKTARGLKAGDSFGDAPSDKNSPGIAVKEGSVIAQANDKELNFNWAFAKPQPGGAGTGNLTAKDGPNQPTITFQDPDKDGLANTLSFGAVKAELKDQNAFVAQGSEDLSLKGSNTYTGATSINAGTLTITNGNAGDGTLTLGGGGVISAKPSQLKSDDFVTGTGATFAGNIQSTPAPARQTLDAERAQEYWNAKHLSAGESVQTGNTTTITGSTGGILQPIPPPTPHFNEGVAAGKDAGDAVQKDRNLRLGDNITINGGASLTLSGAISGTAGTTVNNGALEVTSGSLLVQNDSATGRLAAAPKPAESEAKRPAIELGLEQQAAEEPASGGSTRGGTQRLHLQSATDDLPEMQELTKRIGGGAGTGRAAGVEAPDAPANGPATVQETLKTEAANRASFKKNADEAAKMASLEKRLPSKTVRVDPQDVELRRGLGEDGKKLSEQQIAELSKQRDETKARADSRLKDLPAQSEEKTVRQQPADAAIPQPEVAASANPFSTFSLNVSDVSFKLAAASLEQGHMPDPSTVRCEEFVNAFDYRDPEPAPGAPLAFAADRARYPFAQNRDLLRFSVKTAAAGRQPGRPLNIVLLLDKSGSMERADRVNIVREALRILSAELQPQDKLSIVTFARTPRLWADGVAGDKVGETIARVSEITPEGGTNLEAALDLGYQTALRHYTVGSVSRVVLFTDGAANLGDVNPEALKKKVEAHRKEGVALDCFGIGWEGYNDDLLEQLTRDGDGRYGFINTPEEAAANFATQLAGAFHVAASDVKVQVEFNPRRVTAYRQIGYAKHQLTKEQFRDNTVHAAQIGAAESGNALYVVEVNPRGEGELATVRVRFRVPGTSDYREHEWPVPYEGTAQTLEQASPALRLAATAAAFSEMLAGSPYAGEVTDQRLLGLINGVPGIYGADPRPKKLEWMIHQAMSLSGH